MLFVRASRALPQVHRLLSECAKLWQDHGRTLQALAAGAAGGAGGAHGSAELRSQVAKAFEAASILTPVLQVRPGKPPSLQRTAVGACLLVGLRCWVGDCAGAWAGTGRT